MDARTLIAAALAAAMMTITVSLFTAGPASAAPAAGHARHADGNGG
jgi:hypothetical protein